MLNTLIPQNLFEINLEQALSRGEFLLFYQPIIDARDNNIVAAEALLRWDHPELGLLQPSEFMPLIEEDPSFLDLTKWIKECACRQNREWQKAGLKIRMALNISVRQLANPEFVQNVTDVLELTGMPAELLELEVTESATIHDVKAFGAVLQKLKDMGVHVAIDDFGAGHTALSYLKELAIDTIKIDKNFVEESVASREGTAIIKAIMLLAKELNFGVIAEGIESDGQLKHMLNLGCYMFQGYLFGRPVAPESFIKNYHSNRLL